MLDVDALYLQHLTPADRELLAGAAGPRAPLAAAPASEATERAVFSGAEDGLRVGASPFLTFAVAVYRTAVALATATFVEERWPPPPPGPLSPPACRCSPTWPTASATPAGP